MNIEVETNSRLGRIIAKLLTEKDLIEKVDKGEISVNFSGKAENVSIKVVI